MPTSPERLALIAEIKLLANIGLSYGEVASELGITRNQVAGIANRHCITFRGIRRGGPGPYPFDVNRDLARRASRLGALAKSRKKSENQTFVQGE